jgi:hypothetical protein
MKKTKKHVKKTKRLLKKADFLTLAGAIRANRLKAKSEEDEKIDSLAKSLAHAMARPGPASRQEAGHLSYELTRAQLARAHHRGEI